jgi:transposase
VLCVDEKTQVQAVDRSQPILPMTPGTIERRSHDYVRYGTTTLFAAFNIADGTVIGQTQRRHRSAEFKRFLTRVVKTVPAGLDIHVVIDNYAAHKTPEIKAWLAAHPRVHFHFTPTGSSWINQVERWFAYLTSQLLRRSAHRSVVALESDLAAWIDAWNSDPKPFVWTKAAEEILDSLTRYLQRISGAEHQQTQGPHLLAHLDGAFAFAVWTAEPATCPDERGPDGVTGLIAGLHVPVETVPFGGAEQIGGRVLRAVGQPHIAPHGRESTCARSTAPVRDASAPMRAWWTLGNG